VVVVTDAVVVVEAGVDVTKNASLALAGRPAKIKLLQKKKKPMQFECSND